MTANDDLGSPREETVTKATYRFKVWNELENRDLVRFPRPCKGRIPNFVDCMIAAEKLSSEEVFKNAQVIMVNVDKPQEPVRFSTLEAGKTLVVPLARNTGGLLTKISPPADANRNALRMACIRRGADLYGTAIGTDEKIHIDMIVIGSVAVSKDGHHIGKGRGFSDLEYAVLAANGTVTEDTLVVTTVHDEQIFEALPQQLFEPFDVPLDLIVTPTQIVRVSPRPPRPDGILWNLISDRRLQQFPLLKTLRDKEIESGNECPLKEVDSEPEEHPKPYYRRSYRRPFFRRPRRDFNHSDSRQQSPARDQSRRRPFYRQARRDGSNSETRQKSPARDQNRRRPLYQQPRTDVSNSETRQESPAKDQSGRRPFYRRPRTDVSNSETRQESPARDQSRRTRTFHRRKQLSNTENAVITNGTTEKKVNGRDNKVNDNRRDNKANDNRRDNKVDGNSRDSKFNDENKENQEDKPLRRQKNRFPRNRFPVDFSVKVGNIGSSVRVRDLKAALIEKGVRPRTIIWQGSRGFALLQFAKVKAEPEQPTAVDDVIASLQGLKVKCESKDDVKETVLSVEPAKPISRIENAGVTAV